jgi:hypothetical protein
MPQTVKGDMRQLSGYDSMGEAFAEIVWVLQLAVPCRKNKFEATATQFEAFGRYETPAPTSWVLEDKLAAAFKPYATPASQAHLRAALKSPCVGRPLSALRPVYL